MGILGIALAFIVGSFFGILLGMAVGHPLLLGLAAGIAAGAIVKERIKGSSHPGASPRSQGSTRQRRRIYGTPGHGVASSADVFGQSNAEAGHEGEIATGRIINDFVAKNPNLIAFHSLRWPGSRTSDIDHAILGRTRLGHLVLLIIDSKMWKRGAYVWDGQAPVRDGLRLKPIRFAVGVPSEGLPSAAASMRRVVPGVSVSAVIAVHNATAIQTLGHPDCAMVRAQDLSQFCQQLFAGSTPIKDDAVIDTLARMLK